MASTAAVLDTKQQPITFSAPATIASVSGPHNIGIGNRDSGISKDVMFINWRGKHGKLYGAFMEVSDLDITLTRGDSMTFELSNGRRETSIGKVQQVMSVTG